MRFLYLKDSETMFQYGVLSFTETILGTTVVSLFCMITPCLRTVLLFF